MINRKAFWASLATLAIVSTGIVSAQSTTALPRVGLLGMFVQKSLVGSWVETVTFNNGRAPLKSLVTFHADGTSFSSDQGSVILPPSDQAGVSSSGVGAWTQLDWNTFVYTNKGLFSDFNGNLTGFLKVSGRYHLLGSGDKYEGTSFFEVLGPDEKPLNPPFTGTVTNKGVRISVEVPPAQP